jgi:hypothetical protein
VRDASRDTVEGICAIRVLVIVSECTDDITARELNEVTVVEVVCGRSNGSPGCEGVPAVGGTGDCEDVLSSTEGRYDLGFGE